MLRHARLSSMIIASLGFTATALSALPALAHEPPAAQVAAPVKVAAPDPSADADDEPSPPRSERSTGGGVLFYGLGSFANIDGLGLAVGGDTLEPDPLKNKKLRLEGGGHMFGGGLQVNVYGKYVRGGFGFSFFGVEGTKLRTNKLDNGFSVSASNAWGGSFEVFFGHEFSAGPVRPYIDLVGSVDVMVAQVDLKHPTFGTVGRTQYEGWLFGFGPRAGLAIPLGENGFFDVSGTYSLVGMEQVRIVAGLGIWGR